MDLIQGIYSRRSIRKYENEAVSKETVNKLIEAATMAPSASNSQPWSFVVIQDVDLLKKYSDRSKNFFLKMMAESNDTAGYKAMLANPDFNIFYNAGTLITIYATDDGRFAAGDCSLAAQNLMLAAHAEGLGTCWIGFSIPFLDSAEAKLELGVPETYRVVAALIVGRPSVIPSGFSRKPAEILAWK